MYVEALSTCIHLYWRFYLADKKIIETSGELRTVSPFVVYVRCGHSYITV